MDRRPTAILESDSNISPHLILCNNNNNKNQIEVVDMHFGTGPVNMDAVVDLDPYILDEHLKEIEVCSKVSKSTFFIVSIYLFNGTRTEKVDFSFEMFSIVPRDQALIGQCLGKPNIPTHLDTDVYHAITKNTNDCDVGIIREWYAQDAGGGYRLRIEYR